MRLDSMRRSAAVGSKTAVTLAALLGVGLALWLAFDRDVKPASQPNADPVETARSTGRPTIVEFGSDSCRSCREMKTVMEQLERDHGSRVNVVVIDLLSSKGRPLIRRYGIVMMPTQVVFDAGGVEIARNMGPIDGGGLLELVRGPKAAGGSGS